MADELTLAGKGGTVIFKVRPKISMSKDALYTNSGMPGAGGIVVYERTNNKKYSITATFVSRTAEEVEENYLYLKLLESWLLATKRTELKPSILMLSGYDFTFLDIPTVMSNCNINYGDEVDYIKSNGIYLPIITTTTFTLIESHSSHELADFDINSFRNGFLPGF